MHHFDMMQLPSLRCHQGVDTPSSGCQTLRCKQGWSVTWRPADGPGVSMPGPPVLLFYEQLPELFASNFCL